MTFCLPSPTSFMQCDCRAAFRATCREQQTPQLNGGEGGGVWIVLLFEVTPFECNYILGDPGAVGRVDKLFMVKVYCKIEILQ